jgi:hypothetical protein
MKSFRRVSGLSTGDSTKTWSSASSLPRRSSPSPEALRIHIVFKSLVVEVTPENDEDITTKIAQVASDNKENYLASKA